MLANNNEVSLETSEENPDASEIIGNPNTNSKSTGNDTLPLDEASNAQSSEEPEILATIVKTAATVGTVGIASGATFWGIVFMRRRKKDKDERQ